MDRFKDSNISHKLVLGNMNQRIHVQFIPLNRKKRSGQGKQRVKEHILMEMLIVEYPKVGTPE